MLIDFREVHRDDLRNVTEFWKADATWFSGKSILITGASGFVGSWILQALLHLQESRNLELNIIAVSRNPAGWQRSKPHLATSESLTIVKGDILNTKPYAAQLPSKIDLVLHAAFDSSVPQKDKGNCETLDSLGAGTINVLELARSRNAERFLYISSGAVYGQRKNTGTGITESDFNGVDPLNAGNFYTLGKQFAEARCSSFCQNANIDFLCARLFAFSGPYLPIHSAFAFGNFISNAISDEPIKIRGNRSDIRSYLHGSDMANWILRILHSGRAGVPYNVGSNEPITIMKLAEAINRFSASGRGIELLENAKNRAPTSYYPNTDLICNELGVEISTTLSESIRRTLHYWQAYNQRIQSHR